jgi:Zn-dependent protease with chaperone function
MSPWLVAPLAMTAFGVAIAVLLPRGAPPRASVWMLTGAAVATVAGVASGLALLAVAGAAQVHVLSDVAGWCRDLYPGAGGFGSWVGLGAALTLAAGIVTGTRRATRMRRDRRTVGEIEGLDVVHASGAVAYAVPGRPGGVVIGDELLRCLAPDEVAAVVAHEQAHLRHHHHRFVLTALLCAAMLPVLHPVAQRVRFATERWADEDAARHLGSRTVVARAVARVALMSPATPPAVALGFGGHQNLARVEALLHPPGRATTTPLLAVATLGLTVTLLGSSVQTHHLVEFIASLCRT